MTEYKNFQGPTFSMQIPTDWLITSSPQLQAAFVAPKNEQNLSAQPESGEEIRSNLIVSMRRLKAGTSVVAVAEAAKTSQENEYPKYRVIQEEEISGRELSGFQRTYTWVKADKPIRVQQQQTFFLASNILYTLTSTRPDTDEVKSVDKIFEQMVHSFEAQLN